MWVALVHPLCTCVCSKAAQCTHEQRISYLPTRRMGQQVTLPEFFKGDESPKAKRSLLRTANVDCPHWTQPLIIDDWFRRACPIGIWEFHACFTIVPYHTYQTFQDCSFISTSPAIPFTADDDPIISVRTYVWIFFTSTRTLEHTTVCAHLTFTTNNPKARSACTCS